MILLLEEAFSPCFADSAWALLSLTGQQMKLSFCRMAGGRSGEGFTLLELAITMAIVGILTVSVVGLYAAVGKRQRELNTKKKIETIREAVSGYYQSYLVLPTPDSGYVVPVSELDLSPNAQTDEIYSGKYYAYVATNDGSPFSELQVDGQSIGSSAVVLISSGANMVFEESNSDLTDGQYAQDGSTDDFDDILVCLSANELTSAISWRREIEEEVSVLNKAAAILVEKDDDADGLVDEDSTDAPGNSDSITDWNLVTGTGSLVNAGLVWHPVTASDCTSSFASKKAAYPVNCFSCEKRKVKEKIAGNREPLFLNRSLRPDTLWIG